MVKRKVDSDKEDQLANDSSESSVSEPQPILKARSKRKAKTAIKAEPDSEDQVRSDEAPASLAKKAKTTPAKTIKRDIVVHSTPDGDKYIDLGKKKRAAVRSFKGVALIDIREFYGADGDEKPGKKGISLTLEQWETLKSGLPVIDGLIESLQKKK